jgi:hypothetical protein
MQRSNVTTAYAATAVRAVGQIILFALICALSAFGQNADLQEKLAALKQSTAENQQRLHQYQWIETQQLTLKGDPKPAKEFQCQYGPDGQVQKTPIGQQQQQPPQQQSGRGGRMKERVVAKKTEEMKDYMGDVKGVLSMYVPPNPQKMQAAFQSGNASIAPADGAVNLVFKSYAQPGDQMTITFNPQEKKIAAVNVNTYTDKPSEAVTLAVQFASLPDGTNYAQRTVLNATSKQMVVTTTNANYQKIGQ